MARGHRVCVITSTAHLPASYARGNRAVEVEVAGIPTVIIPVPYSNSMPFGERMRAFVRFAVLASVEAAKRPADVVFATSTPLTIAIPGLAASARHRIPLVFEVRDLWPDIPIAIGALRNPAAKAAARLLEWLAYHASTRIVALSPGMAEGVVRRGVDASRVKVIPNGCDVDLFDVPTERGKLIRDRLPGLAERQPLILYAGTFGLANGVGYLVDVADAMRSVAPDARFLLVGSGGEKDRVVQRARSLGVLESNLWIWDSVPKAEVPNLLAAATVAVSVFIPLPELWHNSANKFFDGLAAGKPVAINYGGWQADLLRESGAGIVLPGTDPAAAARMLGAFVHDEEQLRHASQAARRLAYGPFHRDRLARELETVLYEAVGKGL